MSRWPMVELGEVCEVIMGQAPKGVYVNKDQLGFPLISGAGEFTSSGIRTSKWTETPTKICSEGDIILSVRATVGTYRFADKEYCLGRGVAALRAKRDLNQNYLSFVVDLCKAKLLSVARGATFLQVSKVDINNLLVPLPPLDEQKRIAEILGGVADGVRHIRQQLHLIENLRSFIFEHQFNEGKREGSRSSVTIANFVQSTQYGTSKKAEETGRYSILRMGNISYSGNVDMTDLKYIDLEDGELEKFTLQDGDILFNRTNSAELVGKTAVFELGSDRKVAYAGYLVRARVNAKSNPYYISGYLNSPTGKAQLRLRAKAIVGMANINAKEFLSLEIPSASKAEQDEFAKLSKQCDLTRKLLGRKLALLQELQRSLSARAFEGSL